MPDDKVDMEKFRKSVIAEGYTGWGGIKLIGEQTVLGWMEPQVMQGFNGYALYDAPTPGSKFVGWFRADVVQSFWPIEHPKKDENGKDAD